jgi:hypothetical protein
MARFPFEEDYRHRFGEFEEWRGCHIFIGRHPCIDPCQPQISTVGQTIPRRVRDHRVSARQSRPRGAALPRRHQG